VTTPPPTPPRRSPQPSRGSGNANNTYQQMQLLLESQTAANQQAVANGQALQTLAGLISQTMVLLQTGPGMPGSGSGGSPAPGYSSNSVGRGSMSPLNAYNTAQTYPGPGNPSHAGHGAGGVRSAAARGIHNRYGAGSGPTYSKITDAQGNHVGWKSEGNTTGASTQYHPTWGVNESDLAAAGRRGMISNIAGGLGHGGAMGAARAIPYVGGAIMGAEAIKEGLTFIGDQREKNSQYQSIYGGSNMAGMGQRASQAGFQLSNLFGGGMTWGQSAQAFQGVSALGVQGGQRDNDLKFIQQNYMKMGMGIKESLELVTTASNNLNGSLSGLQQGMKASTDAARNTGQNANLTRQQYTQSYASLGQNYTDQTGGVAAITNAVRPLTQNLGRSMSNVDLTGMLSDPGQVAVMANRAGMSPTQFMGMIQSGDPHSQNVVRKAIDYNLSRAAAPTLNNPKFMNALQAQVKGIGGRSAINPESTQTIAGNLLEHADSMGLNVQALQAQYRASGAGNLSPQQAVALLVTQSQGKLTPKDPIVKPNEAKGWTSTKETNGDGTNKHNTFYAAKEGVNPAIDAARAKLKGKQVQVTVAGGQKRIVDIDKAAEFYPDQIGKGTAIVMGTNGRTVAAETGMRQKHVITPELNDAKGTNHNSFKRDGTGRTGHDEVDTTTLHIGKGDGKTGSREGMTVTAYNKMLADKKTQDNKDNPKGTVLIKPSPELARLLSFSASGNARVANDAAAQNAMPVPGQ
jgi:hypothetical protein